MSEQKGSGMIKLAGLWLTKGKDGTTYMSGTVGGVKVLVFKNTRKEPGTKQPDYNVFLASAPPPKPKTDWNQTATTIKPVVATPIPQDDDEIPF